MIWAIFAVAVFLMVYTPSLWVRYVMHKHAKVIDDMPGNGKELAEHLIERFELKGVVVEEGEEQGDHYDPRANAVRLSPNNYSGKSLTAIAVAAHEVGHAIQFHRRERLIVFRERIWPVLHKLEKASAIFLMILPALGAALRIPSVFVVSLSLLVVFMLSRIVFHLVTLPVEWDASFGKAMPVLTSGYLPKHYEPQVRQVLRAAALTYFAAALGDILAFWRWIRFLR